MTEQYSEGPEEPLLFHKEVGTKTFRSVIKLTNDEIPVARMRCKTDDVFVRVWLSDVG
jgi:hypothetical protein